MTDILLKGNLPAFVIGEYGNKGLIVIQAWWGLNAHIKEITSRFSKAANIVAIAPDLYRGKVTNDAKEASHLFSGLDWKKAVDDIVVARDHLIDNGVREVTVLGFCMGGALAIASACRPGFHSAICFYGIPSRDIATPKDIKCTLQLHKAGLDDSKGFSDPETFEKFENELRSFGKDFESYNYPDAKHAFMDKTKERFHESSASQAFERVIEFLKK